MPNPTLQTCKTTRDPKTNLALFIPGFEWVKTLFTPRPADANKGTFGTALLFCGSYGMAGAAVLAARAALRSGAGLVKLVSDARIYSVLASSVPEAIVIPADDEISDKDLLRQTKKASAVLAGCGIGVSPANVDFIHTLLLNTTVPTVLDADGLNCLSASPEMLQDAAASLILTPHPGEMSRLTGLTVDHIQSNRIKVAADFARKYGVVLVLKGHGTIVATPGGDLFRIDAGNPGMATGGSGDVLAGIIVSLLAQGLPPWQAAIAGAYLHALAGDAAAQKFSQTSMLPSDIIGELPLLFREIEKSQNK